MGKFFLNTDWIAAIERVGLTKVIILILATTFGIAFIARGPAMIKQLGGIVDIILKHKRESRRIESQIQRDQAALKIDFGRRRNKMKKSKEPKS